MRGPIFSRPASKRAFPVEGCAPAGGVSGPWALRSGTCVQLIRPSVTSELCGMGGIRELCLKPCVRVCVHFAYV